MSLFGTILESIIAEIGAEDAYNRFYSSIPREIYNKIVGTNGNVDKVMQFALNCVRDGKSDADSAANMVQSLKSADNNVRNMILAKFKTDEYDTFTKKYECEAPNTGELVQCDKFGRILDDDVNATTELMNKMREFGG